MQFLTLIAKDAAEQIHHSEELFSAWGFSVPEAVYDIPLARNLRRWEGTLAAFLERSHARMPTATGMQLGLCRKIYTDASILLALAQTALGKHLQAIGSLDRAIIIAGAAGQSRLDTIRGLIATFQAKSTLPDSWDAGKASPQIPLALVQTATLSSSSATIPRIPAPSFLAFQSTLSNQAFIVSGFAQNWPALNDHPWRSASYLKSISGSGRLVPVEVGGHYLLASWRQDIVPWDDFLSSLELEDQEVKCGGEQLLYLAQHDLFLQFPELRDDIVVPDYAYATPAPNDFYSPPSNDDQLLINCWLGPEGTVSPPHIDPHNNLYVQIVGQKTIWLAPQVEDVSKIMANSANDLALRNTSCLDVFTEDVNSNFAEKVVPHALSATLNPGDLLYFPAGWWHALRSESTSHSVSFWF